MLKATVALSLLASAAFAAATPLLDDGFDLGFPDIVKPAAADYDRVTVDLGQDLFGYRGVSAANYIGGATDSFTIACGGGSLSATATSGASGLMQLSYQHRTSTPADLTSVRSVTLTVASNSEPLTGTLGFYSHGFTQLSAVGITIPAGSGQETFLISSLGGQPLDTTHVDSMFFDFNVPTGGSLVLDRVTIDPVPEPASLAALGFGAVGLLRRRRRA